MITNEQIEKSAENLVNTVNLIREFRKNGGKFSEIPEDLLLETLGLTNITEDEKTARIALLKTMCEEVLVKDGDSIYHHMNEICKPENITRLLSVDDYFADSFIKIVLFCDTPDEAYSKMNALVLVLIRYIMVEMAKQQVSVSIEEALDIEIKKYNSSMLIKRLSLAIVEYCHNKNLSTTFELMFNQFAKKDGLGDPLEFMSAINYNEHFNKIYEMARANYKFIEEWGNK